jgi:hypothetical protein
MIPAPRQEGIPALQAQRTALAVEAARETDPEIRKLIEDQAAILAVQIYRRLN